MGGERGNPHRASIQTAVKAELLPWFETHARNLPWRHKRTVYRVWVAEIMLQQTRVDTVIAYYTRWMKRFPSWNALARAPQSDVLKVWEGLGYYTRALHLHAAAKTICRRPALRTVADWHRAAAAHAGVPDGAPPVAWIDFLRTFPGIGPYTAAAIASLAFNQDTAVVDGNVIRVLSRLYACDDDPKSATGRKRMQSLADALLVHGRAGEFNEAIMELGALTCLPKRPVCPSCPLQAVCCAFAGGDPERYPRAKKRKKVPHMIVGAAVTRNRRGEVLIAQRREGDMLGGLWEFPGGKQEPDETIEQCIVRELNEELGVEVETGPFLMTVRHAYSHFTMTMQVYEATLRRGRPRALHCADFAWVRPENLDAYAFSRADLHVVDRLREGYYSARIRKNAAGTSLV